MSNGFLSQKNSVWSPVRTKLVVARPTITHALLECYIDERPTVPRDQSESIYGASDSVTGFCTNSKATRQEVCETRNGTEINKEDHSYVKKQDNIDSFVTQTQTCRQLCLKKRKRDVFSQ